LRPTRDFFSRTTKLPKPESLIFSPFSSVSLMVSNTISTISADSFLEKPTSLHTLSMMSALVMVGEAYPQSFTSTNSKEARRGVAGPTCRPARDPPAYLLLHPPYGGAYRTGPGGGEPRRAAPRPPQRAAARPPPRRPCRRPGRSACRQASAA